MPVISIGKNIGIDAQNGRCTYVSLLGLEEAQSLVDRYTEIALGALDRFDGDTEYLRTFAVQLAKRNK